MKAENLSVKYFFSPDNSKHKKVMEYSGEYTGLEYSGEYTGF